MSDSLWPHEPQHTRPPCPSPTPGVYPAHVHRVGDAIQPSYPLLPLLLLPSILPSIRVFSSESALLIRWPKYWSFSFNISPSNEHPGLISIRMDWLDLFAIQRTLKNLQFSSVQSLSRVWLLVTPWITACQASLSITNSRSSLRLTFIESMTPSRHLILCCPLLLLPPIPSSIRVFSNESTLCMVQM